MPTPNDSHSDTTSFPTVASDIAPTGARLPQDTDQLVEPSEPVANHHPVGGDYRNSSWIRLIAFPVLMFGLAILLGFLGIQGSSLSIYGTENGQTAEEAGLLEGPARPIRSDEWFVRTPWVLAQEATDHPATILGGMGDHDAGFLYDLPTSDWQTLLRPHTGSYLILGPERGLALEWWAMYFVQMVGVYALALAISRKPLISSAAALMMAASPATQWWTVTIACTTVGYGCLAGALTIWAARCQQLGRRLIVATAAGLAAAAFLVTLYPPWQIGVAIAVGPITLATIVRDGWSTKESLRRQAVPVAQVLGLVALLCMVLFGSFLIQHQDAITALTQTVYPGQRTNTEGGSADPVSVFSSFLDSYSARADTSTVNGTNQSENSSGLALILPVAVLVTLLSQRRRVWRRAESLPLAALLCSGAITASWMFLPLPAALGAPLLLNRVPASRLALSFALLGVLSLVLFIDWKEMNQLPTTVQARFGAVAVFAAALSWAAGQYRVQDLPAHLPTAAALVLLVSLGVFLALGSRPMAGLAILVAFSLWQAHLINPVQDGVAALIDTPLNVAIEKVQPEPSEDGWVLLGDNATAAGILTASGVNHVSSVSPYPDVDAWRVLDPEERSKDTWNRYARLSFEAIESGADPRISLLGPDSVLVSIDPCDDRLEELKVRYLVSTTPIGECGREVATAQLGTNLWRIFEVSSGR